MPKIYEYLGYVFLIYTDDHPPIHVHVQHGEHQAKVELLYDDKVLSLKFKKVRGVKLLTAKHQKEVEQFIEEYADQIVDKWDSNSSVSNNRKSRKNNAEVIKPSLAVTNAVWVNGYKVQVSFSDNTEKTIDFGPYLNAHSHPYIVPFKDPEQFKSFRVDQGNLVWGEDWDMIFPTWKLHRGFLDL